MAYRRKQGVSRTCTFKDPPNAHSFSPSNSSLAAHRQSSSSEFDQPGSKDAKNDSKGVLARKAKAIIEEHNISPCSRSTDYQADETTHNPNPNPNPALPRGFDKLTSSLNHIGHTFEKALEEGRTIVESKTADIIHTSMPSRNIQNQAQTHHDTQIKASRDVAMATAAKAKLLLRELKTVKADLTFAKERCAQLEEESKRLRQNRDKGGNPADDDLIRLQLETLLAEKARLAHENSIYARENSFLREIVEYHQLTMQEVVYIDEGIEEVTGVTPSITRMLSVSPPSPSSPKSSHSQILPNQIYFIHNKPEEAKQVISTSDASKQEEKEIKRLSLSSSS